MKITKKQLKQIILEELGAVIKEWGSGPGYGTLDRLERGRGEAFASTGQAAGAVSADRDRRKAQEIADFGGAPDHMQVARYPELFPEYECCRVHNQWTVVKKDPQNPCKYPCK